MISPTEAILVNLLLSNSPLLNSTFSTVLLFNISPLIAIKFRFWLAEILAPILLILLVAIICVFSPLISASWLPSVLLFTSSASIKVFPLPLINAVFSNLFVFIYVLSKPTILVLLSLFRFFKVFWDRYTLGANTWIPSTFWYSYHTISLSNFAICSFVNPWPIVKAFFLAISVPLSINSFIDISFPFINLVPNFSIIFLSINWFS